MKVIGVGSQGSIEDARRFVDTYGIRSFPMLWDGPGESWRRLRVASTPAAVLMDARGREVRRWFGPFDEGEVLRLARGSRAG